MQVIICVISFDGIHWFMHTNPKPHRMIFVYTQCLGESASIEISRTSITTGEE